jgi:hypothetical protein
VGLERDLTLIKCITIGDYTIYRRLAV